MTSLADIITVKMDAQERFDQALKELFRLAEKQPGGNLAVAHFNGCARELQALTKVELDLIANGKTA